MGRRKEGRRLAGLVFKRADEIMADSGKISNFENRPFHRAYLGVGSYLAVIFYVQSSSVEHILRKQSWFKMIKN